MALKLKQTPLEWFNPEGYNLIGAVNVFDNSTSTSPINQSIAIRDNYDIIIYYNNVTQSYPSGSVIGNLLTLMNVERGYVSNLKIRRGIYLALSYYLIVEFNNPQGKYEYKMVCFTINGEGDISLNFINTHTPNTRSNIAEILLNNAYIGFLFDLNTIYTYLDYSRVEEADNTNFNNVIENITTFIFEDTPEELAVFCIGFTYDNETISLGNFKCNGQTWSFNPTLSVPIAQGQYFIQNNSSFIFGGTNELFYFLNYSNNTLSLISVSQTFVILNIASIECNTPINNVYSTYVVNPEDTGLISLISNQAFRNLIQVVNETQTYTATFRNYDNTLLYETEVNEGETPSYVGPLPTRQSDNLNDFVFSGWEPELSPITEDTTYIAQFKTVRKQVHVTFKNYNGTILEEKDIDIGTKPTYTGATPTRPSDNYYTYEFNGWTPQLGIIMSDTIYTATYENTFRTYVCTFKDYDGTTIDTQTITAGQYATTPDFKGTQTGYTFTGWNPDPISTQILNDTTFNAVYVKGIAINLYVNTAENDRVDKTNYLTQVGTLIGAFKEETSVMNPQIIIEYGTINFNYIYIPILNRYYYVNEIISVRNNLWKIRLNCDVLMSFKSEILNLECYISRNEYKNNPYIEDTFLPLLFNRDIVEVESPVYEGLENYQFTNNFTIFINTIYQNEAVETMIGNRVINVLPFNTSGDILGESYSYQEGETAFNIVSYIKTDENLEHNIGRLVNFMHLHSETMGSYVLSVVCLPIKNPTSTFLWVNGAQENNEIPVGDGNPTVDIPCVTGKPTGSLPPFELNIITFTPKFNNFLDYEPYSKYEIYLPYYGWLTLKSTDILNKQVHVIYKLQTDGSSGMVFVTTDTKLLFSSEISIAVVFPISTTNKEIIDRQATSQLLNMIMSGVMGTASIGVGGGMALSGGKLGLQLMGLGIMSGGMQQAVKGMTSGFSNLNELIETGSGSVGSNKSSAWNPKKVRTRITSPQIAVDDLEKYAKYIGRPLQENYTLNELNGYTIVGGVHVENIGLATEEEKTEIEKTLRSGFILPEKEST